MKIAVSNIAWPLELEEKCFDVLRKHDIDFLEVAPTKYWPDLLKVSDEEIENKKQYIEGYSFSIVAAQSLLFGRPELNIFGNDHLVSSTVEYLKKVIDLCSKFGCKVLVFGSPKNRNKGELSLDEAMAASIPVFSALGSYANEKGMRFCIEPNATAYGCNFITNVPEALSLVEQVNSEGFGLHLDLGNMIMAGEDVEGTIKRALPFAKHFHLSAPHLAPITELKGKVSSNIWKLLNQDKIVVSIEMLLSKCSDPVESLEESLSYLKDVIDQ